MARVFTADELRQIHYGHGWLEYYPSQGLTPEMLLAETAWVGTNRIVVDWRGRVRTGQLVVDDFYNHKTRIWTERPSLEERERIPWRTI